MGSTPESNNEKENWMDEFGHSNDNLDMHSPLLLFGYT